MINRFKEIYRAETFFKEKATATLITVTYLLGNGIEMFVGKQTDDPVLLWVVGILFGIAVLYISSSKYKQYTPPIFQIYLFYLNFNIVYAYAKSTAGPVDIESFYLLTSYLVFVIISQAIDAKRELIIYTLAEIALFAGAVFLNAENDPILFQVMNQLIFLFLLAGNFTINIQRIKLTQVSLDNKLQFKSLSENSRDAQAVLLGRKFDFVHLNPAISQLTGYPNADVMKMKLNKLVLAEDMEVVKQALVFIRDNPTEKKNIEFRLRNAAGKVIWVESIFSTFQSGPDSKDNFIFTETRDITERKQLEQEIQQQLEVEEMLIKHSNQFINVERTEIQQGIDIALGDFGKMLHADGVLVYRMHGKLHDEFRSTNQWFEPKLHKLSHHFNLVVKINQQLILFLRSLRGDKSSYGNFILTHQLAEVQVLNVPDVPQKIFYLIPLQSGNIVNGFVIFIFDEAVQHVQSSFFGLIGNMVASAFTRLRTEMRLHEAQLTNEFILRALPDWLYIINKSGEFTGSNNYSSLPPYIPDYDLIGRTINEVVPDDTATLFAKALDDVIESDLSASFEFHDTTIHKGRHFKVLVAPFKANEYLLIIRDITELVQAQSELETKAKKLEQSNKELEEFAYIVSHDMKQPIRTIISYLSLLKRKHATVLNEEALEFLNFSIDGANKMSDLIRDILQYSKLEQQINFVTDVELNSVMHTVVANLKEALTANKVELICPSLPVIKGNETMLTELFQNLIENGIKYNSSEKKKVSVDVTDIGNSYQFVVADNGIGFEQEYAQQIFKIFKRLHSDNEFQGTGIGLTICQKVVEKHKGKIRAESEKGKGSRFIFTLAKA